MFPLANNFIFHAVVGGGTLSICLKIPKHVLQKLFQSMVVRAYVLPPLVLEDPVIILSSDVQGIWLVIVIHVIEQTQYYTIYYVNFRLSNDVETSDLWGCRDFRDIL